MSDDYIMLAIDDDGVARVYDDTYDIVIHCESQEEHEEVKNKLMNMHWIPCSERLPNLDSYGYSEKVLVCFRNYSGCEICEYRKDDMQTGWYIGDSDESPEDIGVYVVAWMPLPEPYKGGRAE